MRIPALTAVAASIAAAATMIVVAPARAQTEQQWDSCYGIGVPADLAAEILIDGCTAVIRSGIHGGDNLLKAFINRGLGYRQIFQYERAFADFDQAIRLDATYLPAFDQRGRLYWEIGEFERAGLDLEQIIRLKRRDAEPSDEEPCPGGATNPCVLPAAAMADVD